MDTRNAVHMTDTRLTSQLTAQIAKPGCEAPYVSSIINARSKPVYNKIM